MFSPPVYSGDDEEGNSQPDALLSDHVWEPKEETGQSYPRTVQRAELMK